MRLIKTLPFAALMLQPIALASAAPGAAAATSGQDTPAPLSDLVAAVNIPYDKFVLANGLTVLVHTDRKAPIIAASVWYHIGSKDEPAGQTGFAHLFEHLMFYGSENAPGSLFGRLEQIGATDWNGTTWFDRTNYFETVPVGAIDRALFLESDRMGHLLGAVTQKTLDTQRGVVQNEKRMNDNEPGGLTGYTELATLVPPGHPYHHDTIGSMKDLDAASLATVKNWFAAHYGPNNAVLVLAGDIDVAAARAKVQRWFGDIPRGPTTVHPTPAVPTLAAPVSKVMRDRVATVTLSREWTAPGFADPVTSQLDLALSVLGGLGSSRLENVLVRDEKLAVSVSARLQSHEDIGFVTVSAEVRPGVDPDLVSRRLDAIIAQFLKDGPSQDEVRRAATTLLASRVKGLEAVGGFGGKAVTLAQGQLYAGDPAHYRKELAEIASATPASVGAAARAWMGRPVFALRLEPGERSAADISIAGDARRPGGPAYLRSPAQGGAPSPDDSQRVALAAPASGSALSTAPSTPERAAPPVAPVGDLAFPKIERARLANGMKVVFARRSAVPVVLVSAVFDAGTAADPKDKLGTQALMLSLLEEGTTTRNSLAIAQEEERLGASIATSASSDRASITMSALVPNLGASLDLFADIVRHPAFAPAEVERLRAVLLAQIASEETQPTAIAYRTLPPLIYGPGHPYGVPLTGSGTAAGVRAVTPADLAAFHQRWFRPDNGTVFVVGDTTLAAVLPLLEARLGDWRASAVARGLKQFAVRPTAPSQSRIILIDKPQSPQSMIIAGEVLPIKGTDDPLALRAANDVLGGTTTSRLITDLRETKSWAYYAGSDLLDVEHDIPLLVVAPVQTDKTGESIAAIRADLAGFLGGGVTPTETHDTINTLILSLPGSIETSQDVLTRLMRIEQYGRPDDYYVTLPDRYRGLDQAKFNAAARGAIDPSRLVWVVVGDAAKVKPQIEGLGLPIEYRAAPSADAGAPRVAKP